MKKDAEFLMVNAATKALEYKTKNPMALEEEIIRYIMNTLQVNPDMKIVGLASATEVLKLKKMSKNSTDKEIMQMFMNNLPKLSAGLRDLDKE